MDSQTTTVAAGVTVLGRYVLEDRVGGPDEASIWRGTDTRLRRAVAVRLLADDDVRADLLRGIAQQAAGFASRRAVPVLDVGVDGDRLVVVDEWVNGLGFGDYLAARSEPLTPREAAAVTLELSRCLAAAHAAGLAHGCLRPNSLLVTDSGEVRLRDLGVASVLAGDDSPGTLADAAAADVSGAGSFLYLGLTGRWPAGAVDHVPGAARLTSGALPWPSRVVADIPAELDTIAARAVEDCPVPKGHQRFTDVRDLAEALAATLAERPVGDTGRVPRAPRRWVRVVGVALAVVGVVALAAAGVALARGTGATSPVAVATTPAAASPTVTPGSAVAGAPASRVIPIVSVTDLDPYGADRSENPGLVPLAVDGNPATAWTTRRYRDAAMSGKKGVGLLVDLGAPRPVSVVRLGLVGNNTDLSVLTGDTSTRAPRGFAVFATATGAPTEVTMRSVNPVTTRYLAIWLTRLPPAANGYRGGITEITVLS